MVLQEPAFRSKFDDGVLLVLDEVDATNNEKWEIKYLFFLVSFLIFRKDKGVSLEEFLNSFSKWKNGEYSSIIRTKQIIVFK